MENDNSAALAVALRLNIDPNLAQQCGKEIDALSEAVDFHIRMCVAERQTQVRCEREKRLHIEAQLKQALQILDNVRGEIEATKQNHRGVLERLRVKRVQLKNEKARLSKELANMDNEVARLKLMREQTCQIETRIAQMEAYCSQEHFLKINLDQDKVKGARGNGKGGDDRDILEEQLTEARAVLHQQKSNEHTLRERFSQQLTGREEVDGNNNTNNQGADVQSIKQDLMNAIQSTVKNAVNLSNKLPLNDKNSTTQKTKANNQNGATESNRVSLATTDEKKRENRCHTSDLQKRVAALLLQSEQKSISELNNRMNKHINTLTDLLNSFPTNDKKPLRSSGFEQTKEKNKYSSFDD